MMLAPSDGIINKVLVSTGILSEPIYFMASVKWFRTVLVGTEIWKSAGYGAVFISPPSPPSIPSFTMLRRWMAPDIGPEPGTLPFPVSGNTIATVLLLTLARVMQMFEQILVMYNSAVMDVADVLRTFSYVEGLNRGNVGYATAIGLFTSIVSVILILGCNIFSKKVLDEEIL